MSRMFEAVMAELGWSKIDTKVYIRRDNEGSCREAFLLTDATQEVIDAMYTKGHKDGFHRGAYETETKEDV